MTPSELTGRVFAAVTILTVAALTRGTLFRGTLIDLASGAFVIRCLGVVVLGAALFAGAASLRAASITAGPSKAPS